MFQKETTEQEGKVQANKGGHVQAAREKVDIEEKNKDIREEAISTYKNLEKGIKLKAELQEHKGRIEEALDNTPDSKKKSADYLANRINLIKIERVLPTIQDKLIPGEIILEDLKDFTIRKSYGDVANTLRAIGKYEAPKDPRLTSEELTLLNKITTQPWFNTVDKQNAQVLICLFDLHNNPKVPKETLLSLIDEKSFQNLKPDNQRMLLNLALNLGEEATKNLTKLLNEEIKGKSSLLNEDFSAFEDRPGKTFMENLTHFLNSDLKAINNGKRAVTTDEKREESKKKELIISEFIKEIATFSEIQQEDRGTCAPTTLHHYMSWMNPSELTRLYSSLVIEGHCWTHGGDQIKLVKDSIVEDGTGRTLSERVITSSLLEDAAKRKSNRGLDYSNQKNAFVLNNGDTARETYQTLAEFIHTCESVLWEMKTKIIPSKENKEELIPKAIEILSTLDPETTNPEFTALAVRWPSFAPNEDKDNVGSHAILARGIIEDRDRVGRRSIPEPPRLLFRNPHGASHHLKGEYIDKFKFIRVENPGEGEYSIPLKELQAGGEFELRLLLKK